MKAKRKLPQIEDSLKARAAAVGYTVDEAQAYDGTYWIPSIGHWRSIEEIENAVIIREEESAFPCSILR